MSAVVLHKAQRIEFSHFHRILWQFGQLVYNMSPVKTVDILTKTD